MHPYLDLHPDVAQAKADGRAVVALESTIISHGMPYPQNVATAREVEAIIRAEGAVPATIGILGGRVKIGLTDAALERSHHGSRHNDRGPVGRDSRVRDRWAWWCASGCGRELGYIR